MAFSGAIAGILNNINRVGTEFADSTQKLSSGKKVSFFGDDLYVSIIASRQETHLAELAGVNNALTGAIGITEGALQPIGQMREILLEARNDLLLAKVEPEADRADNTARATALINSLDSILASVPDDSRKLIDDTSADFPASGTLEIVVGEDSAAGTLSRLTITATSINVNDLGLTGLPASDTDADVNAAIAAIDTALTTLQTVEAQLGSELSILKGTQALKVDEELVVSESLNELTAVDLEEESARLNALELQQTLANFALRELLSIERNQVAVLLGG